MENKKEYNIFYINNFQSCHYRYDEVIMEGETFRVDVEYFINDIRKGQEPVKSVELIGDTKLINMFGTEDLSNISNCARIQIEYLLKNRIIHTEESVIAVNQEIAMKNMQLHQAFNMYQQNNMMYYAYVNSIMMNYPFSIPNTNFPTLK